MPKTKSLQPFTDETTNIQLLFTAIDIFIPYIPKTVNPFKSLLYRLPKKRILWTAANKNKQINRAMDLCENYSIFIKFQTSLKDKPIVGRFLGLLAIKTD